MDRSTSCPVDNPCCCLLYSISIIHGNISDRGLMGARYNLCAIIEDNYDGISVEFGDDKGRCDEVDFSCSRRK